MFRLEAELRTWPEPLGVSSKLRMVIGRMSSRGGRARISEGRPSLKASKATIVNIFINGNNSEHLHQRQEQRTSSDFDVLSPGEGL